MAVSEELIVRIRGDLRDIETKLNRLERESGQTANTMSRQFQEAGRKMGRAFAALRGPALAAGAAATGLGLLAQRSLEATENMVDLANRANVSTTFLQRMRFAASQNGASMRDFDDAITRLNRRLGLFQNHLITGTGEAGPAAAAFESLGLQARIASGELDDAESVFNAAIIALQGIDGEARRAALASQLFGEDSGPRLVALVSQGEEGIRALGDEFERLGGVMSDDVAQNAATASAEIRAMQQAFSAEVNTAIAEQSDNLVELADALSSVASFAIQAAGAIGQMIRVMTNLGGPDVEEFSTLADLRTREAAIEAQLRAGAGNRTGILTGQLAVVREEIQELIQRDINEKLFSSGFFLPMDGEPPAPTRPPRPIDPMADPRDAPPLPQAVDPFSGEGERSMLVMRHIRDGAVDISDALQESTESLDVIGESNAFTLLADSALTLEDALVSSLRTFEDTLVDAITEGKLEFDDLARHILRTFARMAIQNYITNPIARFAGTMFGMGPGKATGGPASGLTLVGEQGPELVNLGPMANVMTANMTKAVMQGDMRRGGPGGAVSVNNSYTIDARGADAGAEARIRQAIQEASAVSAAQAEARTLRTITAAQRNRRAR